MIFVGIISELVFSFLIFCARCSIGGGGGIPILKYYKFRLTHKISSSSSLFPTGCLNFPVSRHFSKSWLKRASMSDKQKRIPVFLRESCNSRMVNFSRTSLAIKIQRVQSCEMRILAGGNEFAGLSIRIIENFIQDKPVCLIFSGFWWKCVFPDLFVETGPEAMPNYPSLDRPALGVNIPSCSPPSWPDCMKNKFTSLSICSILRFFLP